MPSGMSFLSNRWVFTGPSSYTFEPNTHGTGWVVVNVTATGRRPVAVVSTEGKAREMVEILNDRH